MQILTQYNLAHSKVNWWKFGAVCYERVIIDINLAENFSAYKAIREQHWQSGRNIIRKLHRSL